MWRARFPTWVLPCCCAMGAGRQLQIQREGAERRRCISSTSARTSPLAPRIDLPFPFSGGCGVSGAEFKSECLGIPSPLLRTRMWCLAIACWSLTTNSSTLPGGAGRRKRAPGSPRWPNSTSCSHHWRNLPLGDTFTCGAPGKHLAISKRASGPSARGELRTVPDHQLLGPAVADPFACYRVLRQ